MTTLGDYRIVRPIGEGAFGCTFLAEHTRLPVEEAVAAACGVRTVVADVANAGAPAHDPARLAQALADLLDS